MMDYDHLSPGGSHSPSGTDPSPTANSTTTNNTQRPARACEYCRLHKVRCDVDSNNPSRPCGRCLKAGRECVSSSYSRKRRKTTDSRVLELERKVEKLTERLDAVEKGTGIGGSGKTTSDDAPPVLVVHPPAPLPHSPPATDPVKYLKRDVIDRGLISFELADRIYAHYINTISPVFPGVVLPSATSDDTRRQKPTVFLAILAASSATFGVNLQSALQHELLDNYSEQIIRRGVKSLELVQALTISVLWYYPPDTYGGNNINQFIHMAAVMVHDIALIKPHGIKRVPPPQDSATQVEQQLNEQFPVSAGWRFLIWGAHSDSTLPESRRALLSCYFLCSNSSRLLRRPCLLPFTRYIGECIEYFETASTTTPGIVPTDRHFTRWIQISHIADLYCAAMDATDITSVHRNTILTDYLDRLNTWHHQTVSAALMTPSLSLYHQCTVKHFYDRLLHAEHITEEVRAFIFSETIPAPASPLPPAPPHATACLTAVHTCLDTFLSFPPAFAGRLPALFYIEMGYSVGILAKIMFRSGMGNVGFGRYVDRCMVFLEDVIKGDQAHAAGRLKSIIAGIKWRLGRVGKGEKGREKGRESERENERESVRGREMAATTTTTTTQAGVVGCGEGGGAAAAAAAGAGAGASSGAGAGASSGAELMEGWGGMGVELDPMMWEAFPLTEFLQMDSVAGDHGALPWS